MELQFSYNRSQHEGAAACTPTNLADDIGDEHLKKPARLDAETEN